MNIWHKMNNFRYDSGIPLHPNPYRLAFSIKEELVMAIDDAICCSIGTEVRKKPGKKVKILKEKRLKLMLKLEKRDIDLRSFMVSIGSISLKHDEKIMHTETNFVSKDIGCQVLHHSQKSNPATSFSHPFYLVIHEYAKKVEKSCHLGVPFRMHYLCSSFPKEIKIFRKK